jgi:hypothetical protein
MRYCLDNEGWHNSGDVVILVQSVSDMVCPDEEEDWDDNMTMGNMGQGTVQLHAAGG